MKYLKYILIALILLILAFLAKGLLTPSIYYENEITVNKPISVTWNVMTDESKLPDWLAGFVKSELVSGTPNTVGAVSNIHIKENGEEMVMQETIKKITENERIEMEFTMDFMDMDYEMILIDRGDKTRIRTKSTTKGNGIIAKSIVSFLTTTMKDQEDLNLGNLKKVIEENTTDYNPPVKQEMLE